MASISVDDSHVSNAHVQEKQLVKSGEVLVDDDVFRAPDSSDNRNDMTDMKRLGKQQEFKRNFSFLSTMGFISVYAASWELIILVLSAGLYSGGFAGQFYAFCGTAVFYAPVVASLAEMESMAPTSGGQYHWTSEWAPRRYQKGLSYASGWMSTLAWLATMTSGPFLTTTLLEVIINVVKPDYAFKSWQYTLIVLGFLFILIVFNTWAAKVLPTLQTTALFMHFAGFVVVIIPLWVLAPKNTAKEVFTVFVNESGYESMGTAILLNQVNTLYCILGADTAVHISEEVDDASLVVPRCMWWSYVTNLFVAFITLLTVLFCIGPIDQAIDADIPYLVLFQAMNNNGVAILLLVILSVLIFIGNITGLTAVSREVWAFSRDKGLPWSSWIVQIDHKRLIPTNAVYLTSVLGGLLCLINLGSTLAFNIIVSLGPMALLSTYTLSIGCVLLKRIRKEPLPPARWSLGKHGLWVNAIGFVYSLFALVWCALPTGLPVDAASANYGPALFVGVILMATIVYHVHGKNHYTPPVIFVEGHRTADIGIQST